MKKIVKIDHQKEYDSAKSILERLAAKSGISSQVSELGESVDNLKTVIDVLIERATPKKKLKTPKKNKTKNKNKKERAEFDKLPSEKFPDLDIEENVIEAPQIPVCSCCGKEMHKSGLYKTSEKLEVIPKRYYIVRNKRIVYNCDDCDSNMVNAPAVPSIIPNSNYGDSLIIDVSLSKFLDLIPMERQSEIAARSGVVGLPPNSLIGLTHNLSEFLEPIYDLIKLEVLLSTVLLADETPHKMLEGDDTKNWYLWGFCCIYACFYEAQNTRSGDVPFKVLQESKAEYLLTDGYAGYKKALKDLFNLNKRVIIDVNCNAHAYRYFKDAATTWESECQFFIKQYQKIYDLERNATTPEQKTIARKAMVPLFLEMKNKCESAKKTAMPKSSFENALNYFLNFYVGLTRCLENIDLPLDNNFTERLMRSPVVGRKTWIGTHSKRGAQTAAILFSIIETCKINNVNPRAYFPWIVERLHKKQEALTPRQFSLLGCNNQ